MQTLFLNHNEGQQPPSAVTVGFFDGVHLGHQHLISQVMQAARQAGLQSTIVTFARHPRQVLQSGYQPRLLTTFDEKLALLEKQGVDRVAVLPFDQHTAQLTAYDFMSQVLCQQLNARLLVTGYDNRFGHNRDEGFHEYVAYGHRLGLRVKAATPFTLNGVSVSSTVVRVFLQNGDVDMAQRCLGHPYTLSGTVVAGRRVGRLMGFPTANLLIGDPLKLIPRAGVYGVRVAVGTRRYVGMMDIGTRPTFTLTTLSVEVHLFGFEGNLYGQQLSVEFAFRLRDEQKFASSQELAQQLKADAEAIKARLNP